MAVPDKFKVLLIDAQNDFSDALLPDGGDDGAGPNIGKGGPSGKLPVIGAEGDMGRISAFLGNYQGSIESVYASMDSHTMGHIGHCFWRRVSDGKVAPNSTVFTVADGKIMGKFDGQEYVVNVDPNGPHFAAMNKYAKKYIEMVETMGAKDGRNAVNTWNIHCLENSVGWDIAPNVKTALDNLGPKVHYFIKGQNQLAEMYSIFAAEAPYEAVIEGGFTPDELDIIKHYVYNPSYNTSRVNFDAAGVTYTDYLLPSDGPVEADDNIPIEKTAYPKGSLGADYRNLQTTFNKELFDKLTSDETPIIVCGEALSHCVQFSARDLVEAIRAKTGGPKPKVYVLKGGSSAVNLGPGQEFLNDLFAKSAEKFLQDMGSSDNTGVLTLGEDGTISLSAAGGRRRRGGKKARRTRRTIRRLKKGKHTKKTRKH